MSRSSIPVDLFNPGQVFACLGFLEAADTLCGNAEGGFDWSEEANVQFLLQANGDHDPFAVVLEFLAGAKITPIAPVGQESEKASRNNSEPSEVFPTPPDEGKLAKKLPIRITNDQKEKRISLTLGHWVDGSSRNNFKLYAGNRSAAGIAEAMLQGIAQLWVQSQSDLVGNPLGKIIPMGGSFNFDPRGAWTQANTGYSLNEHNHPTEASPVVEMLAAWGLENARPNEFEARRFGYVTWGLPLPPILARPAFSGGIKTIPTRRFLFELDWAGKNKIVTFSEQEVP